MNRDHALSLDERLPELMQRIEFEMSTLMANHQPVWRHPNKKAVYDRIVQEGPAPQSLLRYSRWRAADLKGEMRVKSTAVEPVAGFFRYETAGPGVWHLNFADPRLFVAYGSSLMAQDEWQVMEHPALAAIREALIYGDQPALTREHGVSTPVLVMNVPRQCEIDLAGTQSAPHSPLGRFARLLGLGEPHKSRSLYGNAFQKASADEIAAVTSVFAEPKLTNIIAMAAPTGHGHYTQKQIRDVLETAWSGFKAALLESASEECDSDHVSIHTGWWGCGAFGGHRVLMATLQVIAARLAGVGKLVFHLGQDEDSHVFKEVGMILDHVLSSETVNIETMLDQLVDLGFSWGTSDGN